MSIPDNLEVYPYEICWMDWDQTQAKFSETTLKYIESIDVLKDVKMLDHTFRFRKIWLRNIRITGTLLKKGASAGLTLHQITSILWRDEDFDEDPEPSVLEKIVAKAQEMARSIRRVKQANVKNKTDTIKEFKARYANDKDLKESKVKSPDSKKKQLKSSDSPNGSDKNNGNLSNNSTKNLEAIMKGFADFESNDGFKESENSEKSVPMDSPKMNKATSQQTTDLFKTSFGLNGMSREFRKRDRAQSENGTNFIVDMHKPPSSPKRFIQKEEEEKPDEKEFKLNVKNTQNIESSSDDEKEDEKRSPPIKRTCSLPRIKILENKPELSMIKEAENEEVDPTDETKDEDGEMESKSKTKLSSSITLEKVKPINSKIIRQKSDEANEIQLKDSPYDEDFFYYFELYLDESIKKIYAASNKLLAARNRSRSEV